MPQPRSQGHQHLHSLNPNISLQGRVPIPPAPSSTRGIPASPREPQMLPASPQILPACSTGTPRACCQLLSPAGGSSLEQQSEIPLQSLHRGECPAWGQGWPSRRVPMVPQEHTCTPGGEQTPLGAAAAPTHRRKVGAGWEQS